MKTATKNVKKPAPKTAKAAPKKATPKPAPKVEAKKPATLVDPRIAEKAKALDAAVAKLATPGLKATRKEAPKSEPKPGAKPEPKKARKMGALDAAAIVLADANIDVAAKRALSGRRGPVVLQIPQEFFAATLADAGAAAQPAPSLSRAAADPAAISEAAQLLRDAKRPLLIAGAGACQGGAGESLATLSRQFGIPIAGNGLGRGVVPEDSQRSFSWPLMQIVAKEADVVCVVGARLKQRLGYGLPPRFAPQAKFIQIDVEAEELSRNRRIDVPIAADAGLATAQLLAAVQAHATALDAASHDVATRRAAWAQRGYWVRDALQERLSYLDALAAEPLPNDAIHPLTLGRIIAEVVPEDSVFVGDGADIQNWMYGALRIREAPGFLDHYPMGAMGVGTPLAVGAAAAARELAAPGTKCRTVVLTTGDGSFGFYPAELHAAARAGLKLICVVGNDGAWGTELHGQLKALGRSVNTELGFLRYDKVGEGFGCRGEHVEQLAQLRPALEQALAHDGPTVINVLIDREAGATLKTDPRVQMILFDDLASNLKTQHSFAG